MSGFGGIAARRATALLVSAAAVAGCGGDSAEPATSSGGGKPVTIRVGLTPSTSSAPIYLGMKKGFFEEEGLKVQTTPIESGTSSIAALVSGSNQFGQAAHFSAIAAAAEGVPVKIVAGNDSEPPKADEAALVSIVVGKDSDVKSVKDLAGKTVAINALKSSGEISARASLQAQGVDVDTVKFIAVPWPNQPSSLTRGQVDAIAITEPFLTPLLKAGARQIDAPLVRLAQGGTFPNSGWLASEEYIAKSPDVVERFARAADKASDYAQDNPDEVRAIIPTYTELKPAAVKDIRLPTFGAPLDLELIELSSQLAVKSRVVDETPSNEDLVHATARE